VYLAGSELIPPRVLWLAEGSASRMLAGAGVRLNWHHTLPREGSSRPESTMIVHIQNDTNVDLQGGAFASAQVYQGSAITLIYSRLKWAEPIAILGPRILAHTLVHEIAHNLEGVARHSQSGVMKARWTASDYNEMSRHPLQFEQIDLELIKAGLDLRRARIAESERVALQ
jgi:hypothetical protein